MRRDFFEIVSYARALLFNVKVKTNAVMIGLQEAKRLRQLGVEQIQISVYSHRPEIHDAITKLPGSLKRTISAIKFLKSQGLKVTMANVLMTVNMHDHQGSLHWPRSWMFGTPWEERPRTDNATSLRMVTPEGCGEGCRSPTTV